MLNLALTTDKLQMISSAAATVDVHASFADLSGTTVTPGKQNTAISTAATTDIVAAPAASTVRNVRLITMRNRHASLACDVTVVFNANGTSYELHKTTLSPGEMLQYVEGVGFFEVTVATVDTLFKVLSADDAGGSNGTAAQPWFPTAGSVTVAADTTYSIEGSLTFIRSAGAVSHTVSQLFGGTATLTSIQYIAKCKAGDVESNAALNATVSRVATATIIKAASTSATEAVYIEIDGIVRINATGTFIPQFKYDVAPGGAPTIKANSYFRMIKLGSGSVVTQGVWA